MLWDLDPQGAATYLFRIKPKVKGGGRRLIRERDPLAVMKGTDIEGLDLLPADFSYRNLDLELDRRKRPLEGLGRVLARLDDDYDLAILDCPPSISLLSESVFTRRRPAARAARSRRRCRCARSSSSAASWPTTSQPRPDVLAFFSMVDRRKRLHRELVASLPAELPGVSGVAIPAASVVELMGVRREPVVISEPRHPAAAAYRELWDSGRGAGRQAESGA